MLLNLGNRVVDVREIIALEGPVRASMDRLTAYFRIYLRGGAKIEVSNESFEKVKLSYEKTFAQWVDFEKHGIVDVKP